jgi:hypothetical protein
MRLNARIALVVILAGLALLVYAIYARKDAIATPRTLNLSEFGVALTIPATLTDVSFVARTETDGPGTVLHAYVRTSCEIGAFYEIQKNAISKSGTPWTKETLEQFEIPIGANPARVKEFTDFYLVFEPSQEPCTGDTAQETKDTAKRYDLWEALSTAHYMSY